MLNEQLRAELNLRPQVLAPRVRVQGRVKRSKPGHTHPAHPGQNVILVSSKGTAAPRDAWVPQEVEDAERSPESILGMPMKYGEKGTAAPRHAWVPQEVEDAETSTGSIPGLPMQDEGNMLKENGHRGGDANVSKMATSKTLVSVAKTGLLESESDSDPEDNSPKAGRKFKQTLQRKKTFLSAASKHAKEGYLAAIISHRFYEYASIALILGNSVFIGLQTQLHIERATLGASQGTPIDDAVEELQTISVAFNALFAIDLLMRWCGIGFIDFVTGEEIGWNVFDIIIVLTGVLDIGFYIQGKVLNSAEDNPNAISAARVLRLLRVVKIMRIIRVVKFFRELRMMIFSIVNSLLSLVWVFVVLGMLFYVFGITFTGGVATTLEHPEDWNGNDSDKDTLISCFGSIDRAIITLFMAMSGGNDWGVYYDLLGFVSPYYQVLFIVFILFSVFAVVNIVTGVFVDSAMMANSVDQAIIVHEELQKKTDLLNQLRTVFKELDDNKNGTFDLDEFTDRLKDERVMAFFQAMGLDVSEAGAVFHLLDTDHSNSVNIDEFVQGVQGLIGAASNLDAKLMHYEIKYVKEGMDRVMMLLKDLKGQEPDTITKLGRAKTEA